MSGGNYPPGVTGTEPQITGHKLWERWVEGLKPGHRCRAGGRPGTFVMASDSFAWIRLDGRIDPEPWEWEDVALPLIQEDPEAMAIVRELVRRGYQGSDVAAAMRLL